MPASPSLSTASNLENDKTWWVKVTFNGDFSCDGARGQIKPKRERRNEFQDFVKKLDFRSHTLLRDTVTEIILEEGTEETAPILVNQGLEENNGSKKLKNLQISLREDPSRVIYPLAHQFPTFRAVPNAELSEKHEITDGVYRVLHEGDNKPYLLKVINRPFYQPRDSDVIRQELENLELFKDVAGIVQPAGIMIFANPYATDVQNSNPQMVIGGILLEYYSGGTLNLKHVLNERRIKEFNWKKWPVQIGNALDAMHRAKKTHMDLKPSNVVLDDQGNAVLIDISGIGGVTYEWLSPEIKDEIFPFDLPFQARRWNDTWAYGALLKELASQVEHDSFGQTLDLVAGNLTKDIQTRWTLSDAISYLRM